MITICISICITKTELYVFIIVILLCMLILFSFRFYLVFEKVEGGQLLSRIQERVRFTEREAAMIVRDLANALSFLHAKG